MRFAAGGASANKYEQVRTRREPGEKKANKEKRGERRERAIVGASVCRGARQALVNISAVAVLWATKRRPLHIGLVSPWFMVAARSRVAAFHTRERACARLSPVAPCPMGFRLSTQLGVFRGMPAQRPCGQGEQSKGALQVAHLAAHGLATLRAARAKQRSPTHLRRACRAKPSRFSLNPVNACGQVLQLACAFAMAIAVRGRSTLAPVDPAR